MPARQLGEASSALVAQTPGLAAEDGWSQIAVRGLPFTPVIDGDTLPASPIDAITGQAGGDTAMLIGTNLDEARLFCGPNGALDAMNDDTVTAAAARYGLSPEGLDVYRSNRGGPG